MAKILRAASALAVSSNLDMIRFWPYLRFRLPFRSSIALRAQASLIFAWTPWRQYPLSWAAPEPNQSGGYHVLRNTRGYTVLVDLIGKDSFRIASKLTAVLFTTVWRLHPSLKLLQLVCSRYVYPKA